MKRHPIGAGADPGAASLTRASQAPTGRVAVRAVSALGGCQQVAELEMRIPVNVPLDTVKLRCGGMQVVVPVDQRM